MAFKPLFLLLLWGLTCFFHSVASLCNVTCSTDYDTSVNCSCSGLMPTYPVLLEISCKRKLMDAVLEVNGSCVINPPSSWCEMILDTLDDVTSIGSMCTTTVGEQNNQVMTNSESSTWALSDVVKPSPPFNVQVANMDDFYNITWDSHKKNLYDLAYTVRIRESRDLLKDPVLTLPVNEMYLPLQHKRLEPHVSYTVDVQARVYSTVYRGPWSEFSPSAEWRTTGTAAEVEGIARSWWFVSLPITLLLCLLLLGYFQKPCWQKKLELITYVPKPNEFFKPLYHNYDGNFKEWVKPVFSEYDYLMISSNAQVISETQHDVLQWNNKKQSYTEDSETKQVGGSFVNMLQPPSNPLLHLQDGGSSQGTSHSTGHISIHTVTLSGEEFEEEVSSQSSMNTLRSYQDGESFGSFEEDNRENAGYDSDEPQMNGMARQHDIISDLLVENINFEQHAQFNEPERVSLDSFVSNEQSEDGYPHVDLDTIDSGFGECSSPGASDSNTAEHKDSDLFQEHKNSNSNYVKQWMICSTIQEDSGNLENEAHEIQ
ncbi:interleukin 21 receptor, tandem duplicate 1 [Amphiprion ocellaris]|uniref:Fibronectin type-III domain-containing protein n=1 Tax=Amphiprion ocellaris TaxID=80972 RepID=A0A3Q1CXW7_AMPOC|nr:interleukin 21 receptor, tandem duplicate 1 [Amphiprion ocellaris]XP_023141977.1 interleukin 21 receptor, tandem duplicate 1 [Amphiprion ocellaris]